MRLLQIHSGNLYGGVETVLRTWARCRALAPQLESVFALCFDGRIAAELRAEGCEVHILGAVKASHPVSVLRARSRLARLCAQADFDAGLVHSAWSLALLAPAIPCPTILYQHDVPERSRRLADLWAGSIKPSLVIANSRFVAGRYLEQHPLARLCTIHPPAQLGSFRISPEDKMALRARWNAPQNATVVLHAGRFEEWKGHRVLLQAMALHRDNPNWALWIAGQPQRTSEVLLQQELLALCDWHGIRERVTFLGHVTEMSTLMQAADIYCQPNTRAEAFGLTFVEALHQSLAVVSTAMGGAEEILAPEWGLLAAPEAGSVGAAIGQLLESAPLRKRFADAGPIRARMLCSPRTQLNAVADAVALVSEKRAAA